MTYLLSFVFSSACGRSNGDDSKGGQAMARAYANRSEATGRTQRTWARARRVEIREESLRLTGGGEVHRPQTPLPSRRLLVPPLEEAKLDP